MTAVVFTTDIERVLSRERLTTYRAFASDDASAWRLYRRNLGLGAALYPLLSDVEVALRNTVHQQLSKHFGRTDWWADAAIVLDEVTSETMQSTVDRLARGRLGNPRHGRVIAETNLGVWVSLLGRGGRTRSGQAVSYETRLWRPALRHGFSKPAIAPANGVRRPSRRDVHRRARVLQRLRNRVAHHEPIFNGVPIPGGQGRVALAQVWSDTVELLEWMCPDLASLHRRDRRVPDVLKSHTPLISGGRISSSGDHRTSDSADTDRAGLPVSCGLPPFWSQHQPGHLRMPRNSRPARPCAAGTNQPTRAISRSRGFS